MENSLIEQFDKARYNMSKWFTIGWAIWFGSNIIQDYLLAINRLLFIFVVLAGLVGSIFFSIYLIKFTKLNGKINADRKLKEALNNEMIRFYTYKSFSIGFGAFAVTIACFLAISAFYSISALLVCKITLYLGMLSALVANLIYNRN